MGFFRTMRCDVHAVLERDPAARSALEVILLYPGLHAVWGHRIAHGMWRRGLQAAWALVVTGHPEYHRHRNSSRCDPSDKVSSLIMAWAW